MRDGAARRVVKWLVRQLLTLDLRLRRRLQRAPRYRLAGTCNGCGRCCESPSLEVGRWTWRVRSLRAAVLWWQRVVNGFEPTAEDPRFQVVSFRCTHYEPRTKLCDSYQSRPLMCRDYPVNLTSEVAPALFDECSHRVVDRNAAALRRALEQAGLSPEQLAELEKRLFLRE